MKITKKLVFVSLFSVILMSSLLVSCDDSASGTHDNEYSNKVDTLYVVTRDSVFVTNRDTIYVIDSDTIYVTGSDSNHSLDTLDPSSRDTIVVSRVDTLYVADSSRKSCGKYLYDATTKFCFNGDVYDRCGGLEFNPNSSVCVNDSLYSFNENPYDPSKNACDEASSLYCCDGEIYNPKTEYCITLPYSTKHKVMHRCDNHMYNVMQLSCSEDYQTLLKTIDGRQYKVKTYGNLVWMAENLNIEDGRVSCGGPSSSEEESSDEDCGKYGGLYKQDYALSGACPLTWRLPTEADFNQLMNGLGDDVKDFFEPYAGYLISINGVSSMGSAGLRSFLWMDASSTSENTLFGIDTSGVYGFYKIPYLSYMSIRCVTDTSSVFLERDALGNR